MTKLLLSFLFFTLSVSTTYATQQLQPAQIAQQVYDRYIGDDMQMKGTMELISKKGHIRTREFIALRKDKKADRSMMIRFTSPADIKGTGFLTLEKSGSSKTEQHLYLPALKRTRRIVSSQKGRSFVNSDFTYEDMQRHPVEEWSYLLSEGEVIMDRKCYVLISAPREGTKSQYTKIVSWIDEDNFLPLQTHFFNKKGQHSKTYKVIKSDTIMGIATELETLMEDLDSGHRTRLTTLQIIYNSGLKDSLFTTRALEK